MTVEHVLAFAALIVPGFISLRIYDMRRGGEGRKINDVLIDVLVYSFATDLIALATFASISAIVPQPAQLVVKGIVTVVVFVAMPVGLAVVVFNVRRALMQSGTLPDTFTTPWNRMLERMIDEDIDAGVILTLRDGRMIGARIESFATSSADGEELLLGEVWTIDKDHATFIAACPGSCGILVNRADCQTIEFVRLTESPNASPTAEAP